LKNLPIGFIIGTAILTTKVPTNQIAQIIICVNFKLNAEDIQSLPKRRIPRTLYMK